MQKSKYIFYLIGENILSSLSPKIHNYLFRLKGVSNLCEYNCYQQSKIPQLSEQLNARFLGGLSITIPYKKYFKENDMIGMEKIIKKVQGEFSKDVGVINTLVQEKTNDNIRFIGYNTDIWAIDKLLSPILSKCTDKERINAIIIGAGATAQTFCYYLNKQKNCHRIFMYNRTQSKIEDLHNKYSKISIKQNAQLESVSLLINCLPTKIISTSKNILVGYLSKFKYKQDTLNIMDVNYRDHEGQLSSLIQQISQKIHKHNNFNLIQGIDMLIYQAIEQNRLFLSGLFESPQQTANKRSDRELFQLIKQHINNS